MKKSTIIAAAILSLIVASVSAYAMTKGEARQLMYGAGRGNGANLAQLQSSAKSGDPLAQTYFGVYFFFFKKDYTKAMYWYQKAADQGNALGEMSLGMSYEQGKGVPQDYTKAMDWYQKSADQGNAGAQESLGEMYENGRGILTNVVVAYALYNLSATIDPSSNNSATDRRDNLVKGMTVSQTEKAQALTQRMMNKQIGVIKALKQYYSFFGWFLY